MAHNYLLSEVYAFFVIFCRVSAMMLMLPGFGERVIPPQIRVFFALGMSLVLYPILESLIPTMPNTPAGLVVYLFFEIAIGLCIGLVARCLLSVLDIAGNVAGFSSGLSSAQVFNPMQGSQESLMTTIFTFGAVTLMLSTDLYMVFFKAIVYSYKIFLPGEWMKIGDFSDTITQTVNRSFALGVQLSFPFVIVGLVFQITTGLVNRLMPQLQILFIGMPLQILLGFATTFLVLKSIILKFGTYFLEDFMNFLGMT